MFNTTLIKTSKKTIVATALIAMTSGAMVSSVYALDSSLDSDAKKEGYAMGMALGQQIKQRFDAIDSGFDKEQALKAITDVVNGSKELMTAEEMTAALKAQQDKLVAAAEVKANSAKQEGADFLAAYAKKDGVKKTDSGIYYQELTAGEGKQPKSTDTVKVHYKGTLKDGTEFDSSYKRGTPAEFPVNGVIQGWQEILPMMKAGAKWEIAIPSDLAYGERGAGGNIGPNEPLVFEIELIEVK